jgi:hypothetical protein
MKKNNKTNKITLALIFSANFLLSMNAYSIENIKVENNIPALAKAMLSGDIKSATLLLEKEDPFFLFTTKDGYETSALIIAIENNFLEFYIKAIQNVDNINKSYIYNNQAFNIMLHLATTKHDGIYDMTMATLENGGIDEVNIDEFTSIKSIAEELGNQKFLKAILDHYSNLHSKDFFLRKNNYTENQVNLKRQIYSTLMNDKIKKIGNDFDYDFDLWIKMIHNGYNDSADKLYFLIKDNERFNISGKSKSGISPIYAAATSKVYGGNVEYFLKLIKYGTKIDNKTKIELINMSLLNDSFKVLYWLLRDSDDIPKSILSNLQRDNFKMYNSIKSAYIIEQKINGKF